MDKIPSTGGPHSSQPSSSSSAPSTWIGKKVDAAQAKSAAPIGAHRSSPSQGTQSTEIQERKVSEANKQGEFDKLLTGAQNAAADGVPPKLKEAAKSWCLSQLTHPDSVSADPKRRLDLLETFADLGGSWEEIARIQGIKPDAEKQIIELLKDIQTPAPKETMNWFERALVGALRCIGLMAPSKTMGGRIAHNIALLQQRIALLQQRKSGEKKGAAQLTQFNARIEEIRTSANETDAQLVRIAMKMRIHKKDTASPQQRLWEHIHENAILQQQSTEAPAKKTEAKQQKIDPLSNLEESTELSSLPSTEYETHQMLQPSSEQSNSISNQLLTGQFDLKVIKEKLDAIPLAMQDAKEKQVRDILDHPSASKELKAQLREYMGWPAAQEIEIAPAAPQQRGTGAAIPQMKLPHENLLAAGETEGNSKSKRSGKPSADQAFELTESFVEDISTPAQKTYPPTRMLALQFGDGEFASPSDVLKELGKFSGNRSIYRTQAQRILDHPKAYPELKEAVKKALDELEKPLPAADTVGEELAS